MENQQPASSNTSQEKPCRHEYIKIFQRRLKGLDRRMVATRGYLPIGFKQADFGHLSEGSYCFCSTCRARLYPRRTQADRLAARLALAQSKSDALITEELSDLALDLSDVPESDVADTTKENSAGEVSVDELDYESTGMEDIQQDRVKLSDDEDEEEELAEKEEGI